MKSKYAKAIVYDLETGGLSCKYNSITEIAMVAVDLESLKIVEEFTVTLKPRVNLNWIGDPNKDAKALYTNLGIKDSETNIKTLHYKDNKITLKNLEPLTEDIKLFYEFVEKRGNKIFEYEDILKVEEGEFKDIFKIFFDNCYNPQALEVTGIKRTLLEEEGLEYEDAFVKICSMIERHTIGNSKPQLVGHNIGSLPRRIVRGTEKGPDGFDNPFMEVLFKDNGEDFFDFIDDFIIDTLKMARMKWVELPNYSLGTCANEVGLTLKEAHRALPDTVANANFFIKMMQHLRGEGTQKNKYKRKKFSFNF